MADTPSEIVQLYTALAAKVGFVVRGSNYDKDEKLRIMARIPHEQMSQWLFIIQRMKIRERAAPWNVDISKQYFVNSADKVMYGWRIIFQGAQLLSHMSDIRNTVINTPKPMQELDEVNLVGASANRNAPKKGRGAQNILGAVVGPMALARERAGV